MNESLKILEEKLANLDCSQTNIEKTSEEFLLNYRKEESIGEDLVKLWKYFCMRKSNKLPYVYLANDIIQNSSFRKLNFHESFFRHILEVYPLLYHVVNEKTKREIHRMIDIWGERNIYDSEKLNSLKALLTPKISIFENLKNPLFPNLIINKKIKISPKIVEFATSLKNLHTSETKKDSSLKNIFNDKTSNQYNGSNNNDKMLIDDNINGNRNSIFTTDDLKNIDYSIENNNRGEVLRHSADAIKKQNQIFFKHVFYLQEIDKMIDKLENSGSINNSKIIL